MPDASNQPTTMLQTLTVLIYPLILIGVGIWRSRQVRSHADFMVAGRSVPAWMLAGTLICTWVGSGTLFGGAGLAFRSGLSALWFSMGAWIGLVAVYFMAPRVRALEQYTVPDLLEKRYGPVSRLLGTVAVLVAYTAIAAYQFRGGGWILAIVTDGAISPETGMYLTAAAIILFTAVSGMLSIVSVDVVNGIIIVVAIVLALPLIVTSGGGVAAVVAQLDPDMLTPTGGHNALWIIGVALPTFLFLFGESGMYQKFFSARDASTARRSVVGMLAGIMVVEVCIALLAISGRALFPDLATGTNIVGRAASETVILHLARYGLPDVLGAALLAAAVAIVLSTGSTMLLVASSNVSRDLYERFMRPDASDQAKLRVQRVSVLVLALIGILLLTRFESVLTMALYAYSVIGAALTPALVAAFTWRRVTAQGAAACLFGGLGTIVGLAALGSMGVDLSLTLGDTVFDFSSSDYVVVPGVLVSVSLLVAVSLITKPTDPDIRAAFMPESN